MSHGKTLLGDDNNQDTSRTLSFDTNAHCRYVHFCSSLMLWRVMVRKVRVRMIKARG